MNKRLTTGCKKRIFHRLYSKSERRTYRWAMSLKKGDLINSFDSMNHEVEYIEVFWRSIGIAYFNFKKDRWGHVPRGRYIEDVIMHTTDGWQHHISETGCIVPAYSVEKMISLFGEACLAYKRSVGICDERCVRLRSATDDERKFIENNFG